MNRLAFLVLCFLILGAGASFHSAYPDYASIYNPVALSLDGGPGVSQITKFGFNKGLTSSGGFEPLISQGGALPITDTAETLNVVSTSTADDVGGTGAISVFITGIGSDDLEATEILNLDGTTPVVTSNSYKFINRVVVYTSGSGNKNAGDISFTQSSSSLQLAEIPTGYSTTQMLAYKVPNDRECYVKYVRITSVKQSGGGNPTVEFEVKVWSQTQETIYVIYEDYLDTQVEDSRVYEDFKGQPILRKEIFYIEALTDSSSATIGTGRFKLICRKV